MTNQQINAAVAKACGWTEKGNTWLTPNGTPVFTTDIPNYCADLKAMHEAEKMLNTETQFMNYYLALYDVTQKTRWPVSATARHRAEAFLRTLGKWSATDKESLTVGATTSESSEVQSTSSGGSGGASTYGGKGLGIAGATWPPETRITVNGKTFYLADIDKEMTE